MKRDFPTIVREINACLGDLVGGVAKMRDENERLRGENERLRGLLRYHDKAFPDCKRAVDATYAALHQLRAERSTCETCRHVYLFANLSVPCPHCMIERLERALFEAGEAAASAKPPGPPNERVSKSGRIR